MSKPFITAQAFPVGKPGDQYGHVQIWLSAASRPNGPSGAVEYPWDKMANGFYCQDLRISCQTDRDRSEEDPCYGHQIGYERHSLVETRDAEKILKSLRKIERASEKLNREQGYTKTFGEFAQRVCGILGVKELNVDGKKCPPERFGKEVDALTVAVLNRIKGK